MNDTTFRAKATPPVETPTPEAKPQANPTSSVEVPYTDYTHSHGHPYPVDFYELGSTWQDPDGGFYREVDQIEQYIGGQIERGEIPNSLEAVKARLKEIEKITKVSKDFRPIIKISTVAAYTKFLNEVDGVKNKLKKYGKYS